MVRIRKKSLIKRFSMPMVRRTLDIAAATPDNPFANTTEEFIFDREVAEFCTIQSLSAIEIAALPQGQSTGSEFTIFTNTMLFGSIEDTDRISDAIYVPSSFFSPEPANGMGGWFNVVQVKYRLNGVINYSQATIVRDFNPLNVNGLPKYPDTTLLEPQIDTKEKLLSGDWEASWLAENP